MRIDTFAYSSRWRQVHPGEKGLFTLFCLTAALLSHTPMIPLIIAAAMAVITTSGAGVPWRDYLSIAVLPVLFLFWSCLALAISFSGGEFPLVNFPNLHMTISLTRSGITQAELAFARSLGASLSLLFLALTTPMTEIMELLRSLGAPRLLIELMTIAYRQIFLFLEIISQIRSAQEARLGYSSPRIAMKSLAGLTGNILLTCLSRARQNHLGLLARGYDSELLFLSPRRVWSLRNLIGAVCTGSALIALALVIRP